MTTNIQEHNGYGGNNQDAVANGLFAPLSIETLANQLYATPPNAEGNSQSLPNPSNTVGEGDRAFTGTNIAPTGQEISPSPVTAVSAPIGVITPPTVTDSSVQTVTPQGSSHITQGEQGISDVALTNLAQQLLSGQIPSFSDEIASYFASLSSGIGTAPVEDGGQAVPNPNNVAGEGDRAITGTNIAPTGQEISPINGKEAGLPVGLDSLPTLPETNLQTSTTPSSTNITQGEQGFSDVALTELAQQLLSGKIPSFTEEIANYSAPSLPDLSTATHPETPTFRPTDQGLSDIGLTDLAKQLYTQIPSISEVSPPHSPPTSQGVTTVSPLREGDLQNLIKDLGSGETVTPSNPPQTEQSSYSFLSISEPVDSRFRGNDRGLENLNLNSHESFDVNAVRKDFPILHQEVNGKPLIWFDNAATTQKPQQVIDAISHFYERDNSNIHRGAHTLAARATDAYESAREKVQRFLGASDVSEIVFARGTTEAINLVAQTYGRKYIKEGDEIILSTIEHHANIVPWQMLAQQTGAILKVIPITERGELILEEYTRLLGPRTKIVAVSQVSNALGTILPVKEITTLAHRHGARVLIDGAQSVSHLAVNVQDLDCDFYVFSGHKLFAPTGIGALYAKREILEDMPPWQGGGAMIRHVTFERTIYSDPPEKFEAGTPNIADAVGLGAAIDYINRIGLPNIERRYEHFLTEYGMERLRELPYIRLIGTAPHKVGVFSFIHEQIPYEEIGQRLAAEGIAVRAGHHCAQPTMQRYGLTGTVRPSVAFYNTREEIDVLIEVLKQIS
jgi:cysteine desulfurase / selenocysteine lyase